MDENFEIDILDDKASDGEKISLPVNFLALGEIEADDVRVYIRQGVYKKLEKYAQSDTTRELGTILLGQYSEVMGKTHLVISDYIEAKYTDASAATLTFTHQTWDYVHSQHDKKFPDKKIIGWQHTHPSYGIFLSNYDMFIQENFFNLPFQVAYVIDPIQNLRGFFQWKNGEVKKLNGFYIYDEPGVKITIEAQKLQKDKPAVKAAKAVYAIGALSVLCAMLLVSVIGISVSNSNRLKLVTSQLEAKDGVIADQTAVIEQLTSSPSKESVESLIAKIENGEIKVTNKSSVLSRLYELTKETDNVYFKAYTITEGDSLWSICKANSINYEALVNTVMGLNGIDNPDKIYVGQTILLPVQ